MNTKIKYVAVFGALTTLLILSQNCAGDFSPGDYSNLSSAGTPDNNNNGGNGGFNAASCGAETVSWPANNPKCTATTVATTSGATIMVVDPLEGQTDGTANLMCSNGQWVFTSQTCNIRFTTVPLETCRTLVANAPATPPYSPEQYQQVVGSCTVAVSSCAVQAGGNPELLQQCVAIQAQCEAIIQQYGLYQQAQLCIQQYGDAVK